MSRSLYVVLHTCSVVIAAALWDALYSLATCLSLFHYLSLSFSHHLSLSLTRPVCLTTRLSLSLPVCLSSITSLSLPVFLSLSIFFQYLWLLTVIIHCLVQCFKLLKIYEINQLFISPSWCACACVSGPVVVMETNAWSPFAVNNNLRSLQTKFQVLKIYNISGNIWIVEMEWIEVQLNQCLEYSVWWFNNIYYQSNRDSTCLMWRFFI